MKPGQKGFIDEIARIYISAPRKSLAIMWVVIVCLSVLVLSLGWFDIAEFTDKDWTVPNGKGSSNQDAYDSAVQNSDTYALLQQEERPFRTAGVFRTSVSLIYEQRSSGESGILTPENLQAICKFENLFIENINFRKFCLTSNASGVDTICNFDATPLVSRKYYSALSTECELLGQDYIQEVTVSLLNQSELFYFDKAVSEQFGTVELEDTITERTRSSLVLAGPLGPDSTDGERYSNILDVESDPQYDYYLDMLEELLEEMQDYLGFSGSWFRSGYFKNYYLEGNEVRVRWYALAYDSIELADATTSDTSLVVASIVFVLSCMRFHVESWFLATQGLFAVLSCMVLGLVLYTGVFRIFYFIAVHSVTAFLILGIGADNLFVFSDTFRHSEKFWVNALNEKSKDDEVVDEKEILGTFKYGSNDLELEKLGWRLSYTMNVAGKSVFNTMFTTVGAFLATASSPVAPIAGFGIYAAMVVFCNFLMMFTVFPAMFLVHSLTWKEAAETPRKESVTEKADNDSENAKPSLATKFFTFLFIPAMETRIPIGRRTLYGAHISILVCLVFAIAFATQAVKLRGPNAIEGNYQEGHMFQSIQEQYSQLFSGASEEQFATVMWSFGIKGIDRSGFKFFNPNGYRGKAVFDDEFDIAPSANQATYLQVCEDLRDLSCVVDGELLSGCTDLISELVVISEEVSCLLEDFYVYTKNEENLNQTQMMTMGDENPELFYELLEDFSLSADNADKIGFVDGLLKFMSIKFVTNLVQNRPRSEKEPIFDILYDLEDFYEENAPAGMQSIIQNNFDMTFVDSERGVVTGMFTGIALSLPVAYMVLMLGTNNIFLSTYAVFAIICIVLSVLGSIDLLGWSLWYAEAIAGVMVIGLSVDYSVHIGHMYSVAGAEGFHHRSTRFGIAATRMGPTVLAAFVTTAGSASFMFACQLQFFLKMATLILLTVVFSVMFALFFYLPLAYVAGPEGDYGKISAFICRKSSKVEDEIVNKPEAKEI